MKFSGPDFIVKSFEVDALIVSKNVLSREVLEQAAEKLLAAWPVLSFRMNVTRDGADDQPATSIHDGFIDIQNIDREILPALTDCKKNGEIKIYDARALHELFRTGAKTWTDCFRPRIISIQAAITRDATVLKFTMQHIAGDAYAIHNAAAAFCEGLHGDVQPRSSRADVDYTVIGPELEEKTGEITPKPWSGDSTVTSQARAYWDWCTASVFFPFATIARKYMEFQRTPARWQTVYFPQHILDGWRRAAEEEGVKVSMYDLFASWLHMHTDDFSRTNDPTKPAQLAFLIRVKEFFSNPRQGVDEFWNPFSVAIASDFPQTKAGQQARLVQGAVNVRKAISEVREPAYREDYANFMKHNPARQGQPLGFGNKTPQTLILTSWTHAPLHSLPMWSEEHHEREPFHVQPLLHLLKPLPVPDEMDRQFGIVWRGKEGGYWLTATFEDELWRRVLDVESKS